MISVHLQSKPFNITVIQVYAPTTNAEEAEVEWFCDDLQDLLGLHGTVQHQLLQHYWLGINLDYCDIKLFALETDRDHSAIFEIAPKYCISDTFVDYEGHSIFSKVFLPIVIDIMVI